MEDSSGSNKFPGLLDGATVFGSVATLPHLVRAGTVLHRSGARHAKLGNARSAAIFPANLLLAKIGEQSERLGISFAMACPSVGTMPFQR